MMDKVTTAKSKIPIVRHTKSSLLLSNLNHSNNSLNNNNINNVNNNRSTTDENVRTPSPKILEDENSEKKVRRRWKSVVNSLCQSQNNLWWTSSATTPTLSTNVEAASNAG